MILTEEMESRLKALETQKTVSDRTVHKLNELLEKMPSAETMEQFGKDVVILQKVAKFGWVTGKAIFWGATLISMYESVKEFFLPFITNAQNHRGN
jgi:uncharacterized coiled-coil protein SlyX